MFQLSFFIRAFETDGSGEISKTTERVSLIEQFHFRYGAPNRPSIRHNNQSNPIQSKRWVQQIQHILYIHVCIASFFRFRFHIS